MTSEEAIAFFKDMNECTYGNLEAVEMAIKALEQESILDKIRAEIKALYMNFTYRENSIYKASWGLRKAMDIIDKYRTESE